MCFGSQKFLGVHRHLFIHGIHLVGNVIKCARYTSSQKFYLTVCYILIITLQRGRHLSTVLLTDNTRFMFNIKVYASSGHITMLRSEVVYSKEPTCLSFWYVKYGNSGRSGKFTVYLVSHTLSVSFFTRGDL